MPLTSGRYAPKNPEWLLAGQPSGMYRPNFGRMLPFADLSALTTQVMLSVAVPVQAGDVVTNITFKSGATAAGTPTNWWFALYDMQATPALIAQTTDQTSGAWAANTAKTLALSAAYTVTQPGVLYAAVMVKATTPPSLIGLSSFAGAAGGILTADKVQAQTSGSSLVASAPGTIASPTTVATVPYVVLS